MIAAMNELGKNIVDAAKFAANVTGFSSEVVRKWAFCLLQKPSSISRLIGRY